MALWRQVAHMYLILQVILQYITILRVINMQQCDIFVEKVVYYGYITAKCLILLSIFCICILRSLLPTPVASM